MAQLYGKRWQVIASLARGGQGEVFRVRDTSGQYTEEVALKRVLNPKRHARFKGEIEAVKRLNHPNIVRILDHSALSNEEETPEKQFLVMPLALEGDLTRRVQLYKNNVDSIIPVIKQLASALKSAHDNGIIHRDVKPENILFPSVSHEVWLSDFGICLIRDEVRVTSVAEVVGPSHFIAPELEGGGKLEVTNAADIYSFGKVIYYMLSGGVILPRELLHSIDYQNVFEQSGQRQRLFQTLLGKMICPLASRLQQISEVLGEVARIEDWANDARLLPISKKALAGLEAIQQRSLASQRTAEANAVAKSRRDTNIKLARQGTLEWFKAELQKFRSLLGTGGGLSSGLRDVDGGDGCPPLNEYTPGAGVEIWVTSENDHFAREHVLRFCFCLKRSMRVIVHTGTGGPNVPAEPEHVEVGVLPGYAQIIPTHRGNPVWRQLTSTNKLYTPTQTTQLTRPPIHARNVQQNLGPVRIQLIHFSTLDWPAVSVSFGEGFKQAVDTFVDILNQNI